MSQGSDKLDLESGHGGSPTGGSSPRKAAATVTHSLSHRFLATGRSMPVTFKDVTYTVVNSQNKKEKLDLLQGVSGYLQPGELTALMGPSGSGKSTLLDVLSGRKTVGTLQGQIAFAGNRPTPQFLRRYTGYVEQFDTLLPSLTVAEMLLYTADLKRPVAEGREEKAAAVEELIEALGLATCRDVRIGSPLTKGISGGQAKRVNIGIALVTSPRVLFLDEPTSGLDSYTANEVMAVVKSLATRGITVVATIHSPTPFAFSLFDRLLLLLRGQTAYFGENGKPAVEFFRSQCPCLPNVRENESEAEWIVDLTTQADRQGRAAEVAAVFAKSELRAAADAEIEAQLAKASDLDAASRKELQTRRATTTPTWWALRTLFKFRTLRNYRSPEFLGPRLADKLIFSLIVLTLFWGVGDNLVATNVPNISAQLFMWVVLPAFGAAAYVPSIVLERPLFVRELSDGLYRVSTYLVFKMVEELALAFVISIIFANAVFWALQLQGSFVIFWLVYYVTLSTGIVLAYVIAALSPNMDVANAALPAYVTSLLFFAGCLLRWADIPRYWKWFAYLDFIKYAWGSLMANQFAGSRDIPFIGGESVLAYYSLDGVQPWVWLAIELAFTAVFFVFALLALKYVRHVKR